MAMPCHAPNDSFAQYFKPENIPSTAACHVNDEELPEIREVFDGGQCRIYKLFFHKANKTWSMRIPIYNRSQSQEFIIQILDDERSILERLGHRGLAWVPKLKASSLTFTNAIGYPYLILDWIHGEAIKMTDTTPRTTRDYVLQQIAVLQEELLERTKTEGCK